MLNITSFSENVNQTTMRYHISIRMSVSKRWGWGWGTSVDENVEKLQPCTLLEYKIVQPMQKAYNLHFQVLSKELRTGTQIQIPLNV